MMAQEKCEKIKGNKILEAQETLNT